MGADHCPDATRLITTAEAGGSNSHLPRGFKVKLAKRAATIVLVNTVYHTPPATSK